MRIFVLFLLSFLPFTAFSHAGGVHVHYEPFILLAGVILALGACFVAYRLCHNHARTRTSNDTCGGA